MAQIKGERQKKQPTKAEMQFENAKLKTKLSHFEGKIPDIGAQLTFDDGKPMVYRIGESATTISIYERAATVSTISNFSISMEGSLDYAILYFAVALSQKPMRAANEDDITEEMMTKGEDELFCLGLLVAKMKWLPSTLVFEVENKVNADGLYILYQEYNKYAQERLRLAEEIREKNPELERAAILDMASSQYTSALLQKLGASMEEKKLPTA